jgi:hypothetical protein
VVGDSERERGPHAKASAPAQSREMTRRVFMIPRANPKQGRVGRNVSVGALTNHAVANLSTRRRIVNVNRNIQSIGR